MMNFYNDNMKPNKTSYFLFFSLLVTGLFLHNLAHAQINKTKTKSTSISPLTKNENIVPGVLLLKLKPEYRYLTNNGKQLISLYSSQLSRLGIKHFGKLIPNSKQPINKLNKKNLPATDISLIHTLEFDANYPIDEAIQHLVNTNLFEYVEPQFKMNMLYLPNDPLVQSNQTAELLLQRINAYKAWDIEQGDPSVVIGVLDTGTELTHPELMNNIAYNLADPINGTDDDFDGYIDNYQGWDVGVNDNDPTWQIADHGVKVQGACSATPDNNLGITGTGFNCKTLPVKISNSSGGITKGYEGIIYAADHGVKIMNLSWGGYGSFSQAGQDIIDYAAIDNDVLVVAAAGNTEGELDFYPASYNNVISVTGLDTIYSPLYDTILDRRKKNFVSYSIYVDLASMEGGISTFPGGGTGNFGGTSFASPTVAGAAALVRSKYPALSGIQAAELLRVNGDILDTFDITLPESRYKSGRKLNMYKALVNPVIPSIRMQTQTATSGAGSGLFNGDTITMTNTFFNYLSGTNNLSIRMLCNNGYAKMVDSLSNVGIIDSLDFGNNTSDPFKFVIKDNAGSNQMIEFVLIYTDPTKNYYDYQAFRIYVNPAYVNIDTNQVKTTITSNGRFGYVESIPSPTDGLGVKYQGNDLLFEGGFLIGASTTKVSDCIRIGSSQANDFKPIKTAKYKYPSTKDQEAIVSFNDSLASSIIGVKINQKTYAWKNTPNDKFVIFEYEIINQSSLTYDSIFPGLFADWDIDNYMNNKGDWDDANKLAYTYSPQGGTKVAGVSLLTNQSPSVYSMELGGVGGSINSYDLFSTSEKFNTLSKGLARKKAGQSGLGNEVSQIIGAKITNFAPGDTEIVAFAVLAGDDIFQLFNEAQNARDKFISFNKGPQPVAADVVICRTDTLDITFAPVNGNKFAFYDSYPPATPLAVGPSYTFNDVYASKEIYIQNLDYIFPSDVKTVQLIADDMTLDFYPYSDTVFATVDQPILFVNQSTGTSNIGWDFGDATTANANIYSKTYTAQGDYTVKLMAISPIGCEDTITRIARISPAASTNKQINGTTISMYPNPVSNILTIEIKEQREPIQLDASLLNALGTTVYQFNDIGTTTSMDMSNLAAGVYYLKLSSGKHVSTQMVIKK